MYWRIFTCDEGDPNDQWNLMDVLSDVKKVTKTCFLRVRTTLKANKKAQVKSVLGFRW